MNRDWTDNQKIFFAGLPLTLSAPLFAIYGVNPHLWLLIAALILLVIHFVLGLLFLFRSIFQVLLRTLSFGLVLFVLTYSIIAIVQTTNLKTWLYLAITLVAWTILIAITSRFNIRFLKAIGQKGLVTVGSWVARTTQREQGTDVKELILNGGNIKQLSFRLIPKSAYWRAGFKFCDANQAELPLRNADSLLFHVGGEQANDSIGVSGYINGFEKEVHKPLRYNNDGSPIDIHFEINDKNWFKCFVNNNTEFEDRVNPNILKKAFLMSWGDGNNYEVNFENIGYQKR